MSAFEDPATPSPTPELLIIEETQEPTPSRMPIPQRSPDKQHPPPASGCAAAAGGPPHILDLDPTAVVGPSSAYLPPVSSLSWHGSEAVDWVAKFRLAVKTVTFEYCAQLTRFLLIYEQSGKRHFKRYINVTGALTGIWKCWMIFEKAKPTGWEELRNCPIHWDFESTNAELVATPKSSKAAKEEMKDIRNRCREISANSMRLRGLLVEAGARAEEQNFESFDTLPPIGELSDDLSLSRELRNQLERVGVLLSGMVKTSPNSSYPL